MAGRRSGGDRVLESRHLVGLFLGVVLLCGVFVTLGYVMGRTQYGGAVHAESPVRRTEPQPVTAAGDAGVSSTPSPTEWDFYTKNSNGNSNTNAKIAPAAAEKPALASEPDSAVSDADPATAAVQPAMPAARPATEKAHQAAPPPAPRMAKGSIVLQVAALSHQSDAMAMASLLQQKRFPSFVSVPSGGDKLYRVQVGPYSSESAADAAKGALDHDGFKAIIKR
jgi:DedD protein